MDKQVMRRLREGFRRRHDPEIKAPLPPSMLALLAQLKEKEERKHSSRKARPRS